MGLRELLCNCFIILWLLTGGNGRGSKGKGGHRSHVRGARGTRAPSKATSHDPWSSGPPASFFSSIIYQQTLKSNLTHRFSSTPSKLLHLSWWSLPSPKDDPPKRKISGILDTSIVISGFFKRKRSCVGTMETCLCGPKHGFHNTQIYSFIHFPRPPQ